MKSPPTSSCHFDEYFGRPLAALVAALSVFAMANSLSPHATKQHESTAPNAPLLPLFQNGTLCNENLGVCRSFAHFAVSAEVGPEGLLRGDAMIEIDGGRAHAGGAMVQEAKPAKAGTPFPGNTPQSINWGFDSTVPIARQSLAPSLICAQLSVEVPHGGRNELDKHCLKCTRQQ